MNADPAPILALVRDLILGSRIEGVARHLDVPLHRFRDPAMLADAPGRLLIVDLNLAGAIDAATAWRSAAEHRQVVGFVSHVDVETINQARAAGIDKVLARSAFVEQLPGLLQGQTS